VKTFEPRNVTERKLDYAGAAAEEVTGKSPTNEKLWSFVSGKTLTMKQKQILWRVTHNAYKAEKYWRNIRKESDLCGWKERRSRSGRTL
jgi:hypothetical protein